MRAVVTFALVLQPNDSTVISSYFPPKTEVNFSRDEGEWLHKCNFASTTPSGCPPTAAENTDLTTPKAHAPSRLRGVPSVTRAKHTHLLDCAVSLLLRAVTFGTDYWTHAAV